MILVGAFAGNLLAGLTGGFPLTERASASSELVGYATVAVTEVHYKLDPARPDFLRSMEFQATTIDGSLPMFIKVNVPGKQAASFACSTLDDGSSWSCPLQGVAVADVDRVQFSVE